MLHFIPRVKDFLTIIHCSLYTESSFVCGRSADLDDSWSFAASNSLMHSIHRCTWKSLQFFIIVIMMASFMRVSWKACIWSKYSKYISAIERILHTTAKYTSSSSFVYLCLFFSLLQCMLKVYRFACGSEDVTHNTILND